MDVHVKFYAVGPNDLDPRPESYRSKNVVGPNHKAKTIIDRFLNKLTSITSINRTEHVSLQKQSMCEVKMHLMANVSRYQTIYLPGPITRGFVLAGNRIEGNGRLASREA